jgi:hypothetical protein
MSEEALYVDTPPSFAFALDPFIRGLALSLFAPLARATALRVVVSRNGFVVLDLLCRARAHTTHAVRIGDRWRRRDLGRKPDELQRHPSRRWAHPKAWRAPSMADSGEEDKKTV